MSAAHQSLRLCVRNRVRSARRAFLCGVRVHSCADPLVRCACARACVGARESARGTRRAFLCGVRSCGVNTRGARQHGILSSACSLSVCLSVYVCFCFCLSVCLSDTSACLSVSAPAAGPLPPRVDRPRAAGPREAAVDPAVSVCFCFCLPVCLPVRICLCSGSTCRIMTNCDMLRRNSSGPAAWGKMEAAITATNGGTPAALPHPSHGSQAIAPLTLYPLTHRGHMAPP